MCSIIGVGERLHKVLGLIDLGKLDSGERLLPFGLLVLFRIAWWPSAGKELSLWLSACVVFILCCLSCVCFFPVAHWVSAVGCGI